MNDQNESENEKDEAADNGDENDEDYQYEEGKKDRAHRRDAVNGRSMNLCSSFSVGGR